MGKNTRRQLEIFDRLHSKTVYVDSVEESDMFNWLCEAAELGLILDFQYQPEPIKLFDSVDYVNSKNKKRNLFREHVYTPDFIIKVKPGSVPDLDILFKIPYDRVTQSEYDVYVDVKGTFMSNDGGRSFSINQKWVYQLTGIYVQKIVPKDFFKKAGCPKESFVTRKTNKSRKMFAGYPSISQSLKK